MSFNIRDHISDDHIESISEIATGQASIIQALSLDNSQKDKEIERLNKELKQEKIDFKEANDKCFELILENKRLNNIIKEVRESANKELKIAKENIKQSEKWLDIEEVKENVKRDIHTGKVIIRDMEMFLNILDKGV